MIAAQHCVKRYWPNAKIHGLKEINRRLSAS